MTHPNRAELQGDVARQAVASLRGAIYQAWCSIDAWLRLRDEEQVIYLEGAEDFDIVGGANDVAVQVKDNSGSFSLGNSKAREAVENFWTLAEREPERLVHMHYLTTSAAVRERDADFGGLNGLDAWRAARTNPDLAVAVGGYLSKRLGSDSLLRHFLENADAEQLQQRLFTRVFWFTDLPGIEGVQRSVDDRLASLLFGLGRPVRLVDQVRVHLESRFWELVREPRSDLRRLTRGDLLRQLEQATTSYLPVPVERLTELFGGARPGANLLTLLRDKVPLPPSPLVPRVELTQRLTTMVEQRRSVLLTGGVYKGKTTIAQLVATSHCPDAWWVNLTGRTPDQVDNLLLALAGEIDAGNCPALVVIDDLDISPAAHRVYGPSLSLVLHRGQASGRGVILTAQGESSATAHVPDFVQIDVMDVPDVAMEEVKELCRVHGCPPADVEFWGFAIHIRSRGHPKLVQVRLAELLGSGWPRPAVSKLVEDSPGTQSVRQLARQLLHQSASPEAAELVYAVSDAHLLLHRTVIVKLAELIGLRNAGDALDALSGTWIERIEGDWFRTTSLLQGAAAEAWSPDRRRVNHLHLHNAISSKGTLSPAEAAALLYHAYLGQHWALVAADSIKLQLLERDDAQREVERSLFWLPYVSLEPGSSIAGDALSGAALRSMQFRVAVTLDANTLPAICDRWVEETRMVPHREPREMMQALMWGALLTGDSTYIPLPHRLSAIDGLSALDGSMEKLFRERMEIVLKMNDPTVGIPATATPVQFMLALTGRWVRDAQSLRDLVAWLDTKVASDIRAAFDAVLEWKLVQTMGAFVQSAWATKHEEVKEWEPWLELFDHVQDYARRRQSPRLGCEAAKAKATILTEELDRGEEALAALVRAEELFGKSIVLDEQRANVLFQGKDDEAVLMIWSGLVDAGSAKVLDDPYAYRRAAISAARLQRWGVSADMFRVGASCAESAGFEVTRFGMLVDCALAELLGGRVHDACKTLARAVMALPEFASHDGGERWEPVQRIASDVCGLIERAGQQREEGSKVSPGDASSPAMKLDKTEPGQLFRTLLLRTRCAKVAAMHGVLVPQLEAEICYLDAAAYQLVRWGAAEARLARSFLLNGEGFAHALAQYDLQVSGMAKAGVAGHLMLPDEDSIQSPIPTGFAWFELIVAAAWCAGPSLESCLASWSSELAALQGFEAPRQIVEQLKMGISQAADELHSTVENRESPVTVRCAAALRLLLLRASTPSELLQLHCLLGSALVSQGATPVHSLWNLEVARRIASDWRLMSEGPFLFASPSKVLPLLRSAICDVDDGRGTARTILAGVHQAMGKRTPEFVGRLP